MTIPEQDLQKIPVFAKKQVKGGGILILKKCNTRKIKCNYDWIYISRVTKNLKNSIIWKNFPIYSFIIIMENFRVSGKKFLVTKILTDKIYHDQSADRTSLKKRIQYSKDEDWFQSKLILLFKEILFYYIKLLLLTYV